MTGPYPPEYGAGPVGPQMYGAQPYPENVPSPYPSMLPPPLPYPKRRWWWPVGAVALALVVVAALVTAIVFASRHDGATGEIPNLRTLPVRKPLAACSAPLAMTWA